MMVMMMKVVVMMMMMMQLLSMKLTSSSSTRARLTLVHHWPVIVTVRQLPIVHTHRHDAAPTDREAAIYARIRATIARHIVLLGEQLLFVQRLRRVLVPDDTATAGTDLTTRLMVQAAPGDGTVHAGRTARYRARGGHRTGGRRGRLFERNCALLSGPPGPAHKRTASCRHRAR